MSSAIILIAMFGFFFIVKTYLRHAKEQKLRAHPPKRRSIEISLPRGVNDSNKRMQKIMRKVLIAAQSDSKGRKAGEGQLEFLYMFEYPSGATMPMLRFIIQCDESKMDTVKRVVKQGYDGNASVQEVDKISLDEVIADLTPKDESDAAPEVTEEQAA